MERQKGKIKASIYCRMGRENDQSRQQAMEQETDVAKVIAEVEKANALEQGSIQEISKTRLTKKHARDKMSIEL